MDANGNGIPDYMDELLENQELQKEYSNSVLEDLYIDSDNDGIPDDEDSFSFDGSLTIDLSGLTDGIEE
ncbi:MAG: hypothetical protein LBC61_00745 [Candidatus Peribacteria bacterium]|jgi:hypothetical protein|nr:hypothetical protein [Candidatus Peribacteria bacterium]